MKVRFSVQLLFTVFLGLLLVGCGEVINEYYISNHTETAVSINMTPVYIDTVDISSGPLIETLEITARDSLTQTLDYEIVADTIQLTIPPDTTVYLGSSFGGNDLFTHLELHLADEQILMDADNYSEHFALHDNFIGPLVHIFDIR
jgi:hypothetical protein